MVISSAFHSDGRNLHFSGLLEDLREIGLCGVLAFDIETFSPNGFPYNFEDPVVNFSLVAPFDGSGFLLLSVIGEPKLENAMLSLLHRLMPLFEGFRLLTYNGSRFDLEYTIERGHLYGLDFEDVFSSLHHIDVYRVVRWLNFNLPRFDQKSVERYFGFRRIIRWISGGTYHAFYRGFLKYGNLKPVFYNIEDSYGCLRIADAISRLAGEGI